MKRICIVLCALFALTAGAVHAQTGAVSANTAAPTAPSATSAVMERLLAEDGRYRFRPGDTLEVSVLEDPSMNRQVLVLPDGRISIPVAGTMIAGGKTPDELARRIARSLSSIFLTPPSVTVSLLNIGGIDDEPDDLVFVVGEVRNPGAFPYNDLRPMTALQVLALAGGPGPYAARSRIQIHHNTEGVVTVTMLDYDAIENGELATAGPLLSEGDIIVVPERSLF